MAPYAANSKPFARASLILIGLAWTLPFLQPYHRFPLTGFYSEWLAFALGLAAALILLRRDAWGQSGLTLIALAPIALAGVVGVQAALGRVPYPEHALTVALYLMWAALIAVLGAVLRRELGIIDMTATLAWWLLAGGVLAACGGLLQHFHAAGALGFLIAAKQGPEIYGNLGQANHYSSYLVIALVCATYLHGRGRLAVGWVAACAALLLPALALSGSRSIWLYLGALLVLAWLSHRLNPGSESRRFLLLSVCWLPGLAIAHALVRAPFAIPAESVTPMVTSAERVFEVAGGIEVRLRLWREAWQMFLDAPLLGAGTGQFAWHHFVYQAASGTSADPRLFNHAHNLLLHLMAETGAVGALIVAGALLAWLAGLRRAPFDMERCWLLGVLAVIGVHSLLEFPLWYAYFLGMAALLLGMGAERFFGVPHAGAARAIIAAGIAAGCLNLISVMPAYREFERLVFSPGAARPADDAGFARVLGELYREPLLVPYIELAIAYTVEVNEEELPAKLALTGRAVHFAPAPVVAYRYALLLALSGQREASLAQLDRALRVYPSEAPGVVLELERLARRYPGQFNPLLELAAARSAYRRAPAATR